MSYMLFYTGMVSQKKHELFRNEFFHFLDNLQEAVAVKQIIGGKFTIEIVVYFLKIVWLTFQEFDYFPYQEYASGRFYAQHIKWDKLILKCIVIVPVHLFALSLYTLFAYEKLFAPVSSVIQFAFEQPPPEKLKKINIASVEKALI